MKENTLTIRSAQPADAALISGAYRSVWLEEMPDQTQIRAVLQDPCHAVTIALRGEKAAGFLKQPEGYGLYITRLPAKRQTTVLQGAALIPVQTFAYGGFWLVGDLTEEAFWVARAVLGECRGLAGVLIHDEQAAVCQSAVAAGFVLMGAYHWWHYCW